MTFLTLGMSGEGFAPAGVWKHNNTEQHAHLASSFCSSAYKTIIKSSSWIVRVYYPQSVKENSLCVSSQHLFNKRRRSGELLGPPAERSCQSTPDEEVVKSALNGEKK